jgi:4-amino-4-deoxy-L-arabinose transferase-like glycosyltransferase
MNKKRLITIFLSICAAISVIWIFWLSLTPLIDRDGTRFHLPFAKLWAENGFMYFRKYFAYYDLNMLNLNYLYMLVFKFGMSDQFTKIIHAAFLVAGAFLIFRYFKEKYGFNWGALSFLMYITIPVHQRLASEVYVDLGLLFFSTLSIIYFIKWLEGDFENRKYLIVSALGAGLGFGTKYNGVIFAFFMTLFVALVISREKKDDKLAIKSMLIYGTIIFITVLPWLLRNYLNSGNPFFPLFNSVIPSHITMPAELSKNVYGETAWRMNSGNENLFTLALLPFRVFFEGADHNLIKYDGVLNPFMFLLLPFIFWPGIKNSVTKKLVLYLFVLFWMVYLSTFFANNIRIRYFIPVYPILILLNVESLRNLRHVKKIPFLQPIAILLFFLPNLLYAKELFSVLNLNELNPFSTESRNKYLENNLPYYDIFDFINNNTPENSVIYESFTGGRSYYISRTFFSDTSSIDRYLLELLRKGASIDKYIEHFKNLPNSSLSATHFLTKPNAVLSIADILKSSDEGSFKNAEYSGYIEFLNGLKILKSSDGVYLFEL